MKKLIIFLLAATSAFAQTDQYGGLLSLNSPTGSTGVWKVEKYANNRWLITTPDGHGLWFASQFATQPPASLNINAKYGNTLNWQNATVNRITNWGFNGFAEYSDIGLITSMNAGNLDKRIPYSVGYAEHMVLNAVWRRGLYPGQVLPTDAVKNLAGLIPRNTNYKAMMSDGFDPNYLPYIEEYLIAKLATSGDPYVDAQTNAWNAFMSIEDADFMYGFGPGPDDCVSADGVYHTHIGWAALASAPNLYIQWSNTSDLYDAQNWTFSNPVVAAKANLITFLKARYSNSISALNTAWSSTYTAFDSARTRFTGETVGTTDGMVTTISHTLANAGASPMSLALKVDGTTRITDYQTSATGGVFTGTWPDGTTSITGTVNYSTGEIEVTAGGHQNDNVTNTGGATTWATPITLTHGNIVPGTVYLYLFPEQCRITDDMGAGNSWEVYPSTCPNSPYTVTGTINYSAGTISNLVISPAIPNDGSHFVQFQYQYSISLPGTHTVTVDYDTNGYGVGTTLADEDGTHTAWLGTTDGILPKASVPLAVWTDLSDWLYNYTDALYEATITPTRAAFPGKIIIGQMSGIAGHHGCPREAMARGMSDNADVITVSQLTTQPILNLFSSWGLGDRPVMNAWNGLGAQLDSPFAADGWNNVASDNYPTQAQRGTAYANLITAALTTRASGNPVYQIIGIKFWAYTDTVSEHQNYGLTSPKDNAYDGHETVTGSVMCSSPIQDYPCGGEAANYGDAITPIQSALATIPATISAGSGGDSGGGSIDGRVTISGKVTVH